MDKYIERLYQEWVQHSRIVLAVDYDSTIRPWKSIDNQEDIDRTIKLVKLAQETGAYIVIHTACNPDRYTEITNYCKDLGIYVNTINVNPVVLPYGKNQYGEDSKIFYNHQLCDRSGLIEALDILEKAMYRVRGDKNTESTLNQTF